MRVLKPYAVFITALPGQGCLFYNKIMPNDDDKIIFFPAKRPLKHADKAGRAQPSPKQPFFNTRKIPPFTRALIALLIAVQIALMSLAPPERYDAFQIFGFVPGFWTGAANAPSPWAYVSPITHMFIHGGWEHLVFNIFSLLAFGILLERMEGAKRCVSIFLFSGITGAAAFLLSGPHAVFPLIGASGGISGLFGAALQCLSAQQNAAHPQAGKAMFKIMAFWIVFMIASGMMTQTAWQAHVGGFLGGAALYAVYRRRRVRS